MSRLSRPVFVALWQGKKPELHILGAFDRLDDAEAVCLPQLHKVSAGMSLHVVEARLGEEGYTNAIDYEMSADGSSVERHLFVRRGDVPALDSSYRPVVNVMWY